MDLVAPQFIYQILSYLELNATIQLETLSITYANKLRNNPHWFYENVTFAHHSEQIPEDFAKIKQYLKEEDLKQKEELALARKLQEQRSMEVAMRLVARRKVEQYDRE